MSDLREITSFYADHRFAIEIFWDECAARGLDVYSTQEAVERALTQIIENPLLFLPYKTGVLERVWLSSSQTETLRTKVIRLFEAVLPERRNSDE